MWLDKNATKEFSSNVELMDVNDELIGSLETEAIYRKLSRVVHKADLLRYEVILPNPSSKIVLGCVQIWRDIH